MTSELPDFLVKQVYAYGAAHSMSCYDVFCSLGLFDAYFNPFSELGADPEPHFSPGSGWPHLLGYSSCKCAKCAAQAVEVKMVEQEHALHGPASFTISPLYQAGPTPTIHATSGAAVLAGEPSSSTTFPLLEQAVAQLHSEPINFVTLEPGDQLLLVATTECMVQIPPGAAQMVNRPRKKEEK